MLNILIPWGGVIGIDPLLTLAGSIGGPEANLLLLTVTAGHVDDGGTVHASSPDRQALAPA